MSKKPKIKLCQFCANWGTMSCPNSSKCFALSDKPYWKGRKRITFKQWQDEVLSRDNT